ARLERRPVIAGFSVFHTSIESGPEPVSQHLTFLVIINGMAPIAKEKLIKVFRNHHSARFNDMTVDVGRIGGMTGTASKNCSPGTLKVCRGSMLTAFLISKKLSAK